MITETEGDATYPVGDGPKVIAHCCNNKGYWGKGFVTALSARWPIAEIEYRKWYAGESRHTFALGEVQFVSVASDLWVANIIGQDGIRTALNKHPISYPAVSLGLSTVARFAKRYRAGVHMPRIGSGLAGGDWTLIRQYIEIAFDGLSVTIYTLPDPII